METGGCGCLVGVSLKDDPFTPGTSDKWHSDMVNWPKIKYGHIFAYFLSRPGTYTQEQLLSWKQLEAYNYFQNGYMRTVWCLVLVFCRSATPTFREK